MTNAELAFQFAKEISTQLITLSSALIGVSVTFIKDFRSDSFTPLRVGWLFYVLCILCGVWTLMTLTGTLEGMSDPSKTFTGFAGSTRLAASCQILSFIVATIAMVWFGWTHALERQAAAAPVAVQPPPPLPPTLPVQDPKAAAAPATPPQQTPSTTP